MSSLQKINRMLVMPRYINDIIMAYLVPPIYSSSKLIKSKFRRAKKLKPHKIESYTKTHNKVANKLKLKYVKNITSSEISFGKMCVFDKLIDIRHRNENNRGVMLIEDDKYVFFRCNYENWIYFIINGILIICSEHRESYIRIYIIRNGIDYNWYNIGGEADDYCAILDLYYRNNILYLMGQTHLYTIDLDYPDVIKLSHHPHDFPECISFDNDDNIKIKGSCYDYDDCNLDHTKAYYLKKITFKKRDQSLMNATIGKILFRYGRCRCDRYGKCTCLNMEGYFTIQLHLSSLSIGSSDVDRLLHLTDYCHVHNGRSELLKPIKNLKWIQDDYLV